MAFPFKIPKKKHAGDSDSAHMHLQSPLSRLQSSAPQTKGYGDQSGRGGADRVHAGSSAGRLRTPCRPLFTNVVKTLLGLNSPDRGGASAANRSSPGSWSRQSRPGETNGWRPKRASDRLLPPESTSERLSPPQKKKSAESSRAQSISVEAGDSLAELRPQRHAGSLSSAQKKSDAGQPQKKNSSSSGPDEMSDDEFMIPSRTRTRVSAGMKTPPPSSSSVSTAKALSSPAKALSSPWATAASKRSVDQMEEVMEAQRDRWRQFREKKSRPAVLHLRLKKPKQTAAEPIVLSSEEEEEDEDEQLGDEAQRTSQRGNGEQQVSRELRPTTPPSFLQLEFTSVHAGLEEAHGNGPMMITENSITLPVKGAEEGEVTVVASQLRGYGVWDGGVARGGALLEGWQGPAPSLLFLWVSDPQANLLQREMSSIQNSSPNGPPCSFLLLVLQEQLQELQAALLASILDLPEYQQGRSAASSSGGPTSPLEWADGLLLVHSCPPPVDQHILRLLGHSTKSSRLRSRQGNRSGLQQLPTRLLQYPLVPCRGRITVTQEDLACLDAGEFLNDVIIDFYLKYLLLEGVAGAVAQRSHVFSSFFFKQLSRRRAAGEDHAPSVPDRHMRHQRVKTWTRHEDIFTKDFLFVPVNQEAHWFLVVVCFPGLDAVRHEDFQPGAGGSEKPAGKSTSDLKSQQTPECTEQGWRKSRVMKRPCILVMDSLKLSYHENVCRLIRDYLQVEWEVRRKTPRLFTSDNIRSSNCRVPQQDNSSDCGVFLLQYVESFLQNPVVHFDFPLRLENWFPRQQVRQKREEIRSLIVRLQRSQQRDGDPNT